MDKTENNEQLDSDILQCKADILRARDIIPGTQPSYREEPREEAEPQQTGQNIMHPADEVERTIEEPRTEPLPITPIKETAEAGGGEQEKAEIPRFDLAEDIMAEQRKITAIRRKAPGQKTEPQKAKPGIEPDSRPVERPRPMLSEEDRIIAEIVARDIERLCRGDYLADS